MAGRNDVAMAAALQAVAQAVAGANVESRTLGTFQRENPPTFQGRYDPDGAQDWLKEIERTFRVMDCSEAQKVRYGTHMLAKEADDWWVGTRQRLEATGEVITWAVFVREFLREYFPEDARGKKEMEFLELKQGDSTITEYAAKFVELVKFYPHYHVEIAEFSKCIKFENGLRPEIKKAIGYQQIRTFHALVNSCRIFEEDSNASSAHYKSQNEKKVNRGGNRGKPYSTPADKGKQRAYDDRKSGGGGRYPSSMKCFKCGDKGHRADQCQKDVKRCYRCGKTGHVVGDCQDKLITCFNCGEQGHISTNCPKPKKPPASGKVFALAGAQPTSADRLIKGIIDTGATHSFISVDCARRLNLVLSPLGGDMVIDTPSSVSITTALVCLSCPLTIYGK